MSNRKYRHFLCTSICVHLFHWNERVIQGWPMLLLYCQHWHFNSVIENYISGKLNWFALLHTVSWQWLINHHHFSQYFCVQSYRIASYNVGSLGAILVVFTFLNLVTRQSFNCATDFCIFKSTVLCETALRYTKQTTINKQILWKFQKNFFQRSKKWQSPSFFRCFAPCRAFLWAEKLSFSVILPPKNAQTFNWRHFFFTPLIYHCLKSQLSK